MIRPLYKEDNNKIMNLLKVDSIINYFIILGLEREKYKKTFISKWGEFNNRGELVALLFKRKTGNIQFYGNSGYDYKGFYSILKREGYRKLIGEEGVLKPFIENYNFSKIEKGAFLSKLDNISSFKDNTKTVELKKIKTYDLDGVIDLYSKVFNGFTSKEMMKERLNNSTGRGYYIEYDKKIISIAQSAYEDLNSAIIVGVATDPYYQKRGLASICLGKICKELILEGKTLYLQYDNIKAGEIYKRMGFRDIGRMISLYP